MLGAHANHAVLYLIDPPHYRQKAWITQAAPREAACRPRRRVSRAIRRPSSVPYWRPERDQCERTGRSGVSLDDVAPGLVVLARDGVEQGLGSAFVAHAHLASPAPQQRKRVVIAPHSERCLFLSRRPHIRVRIEAIFDFEPSAEPMQPVDP
jgi:hypothetical protein